MSDLLEKQINTVFALRKIKFFEIQQNNSFFSMRPQMHLLIVKPFGTIKSSYTQEFEDLLDEDLVQRDQITMPALLGTVTKNKEYVPGLPAKIGGKILLLDEFNNIEEKGLKALLGILENQKINREIGFAVPKKLVFEDEWTSLQVENGSIQGHINFSCIAFSMFYPKPSNKTFFEENPQALLGLKSRFTPNFTEPDHEELIAALGGEKPFLLKDVGKTKIRRILIEKEAYATYIAEFGKLTLPLCEGEDAHLRDKKQIGFLTRINSDILRFAAHEKIQNGPVFEKDLLQIADADCLVESAKSWAEPLLKQYLYEERAGDMSAFEALLFKRPGLEKSEYARLLNVNRRTVQRWLRVLHRENKLFLQ